MPGSNPTLTGLQVSKSSSTFRGRRGKRFVNQTTRYCRHRRWKSTDNRHRSSIIAVCQQVHRGKLKRSREPWTRCFPTHTLVHLVGPSRYSDLALPCLPSPVPIPRVYSLPSSLELSHLICLSEDHPGSDLQEGSLEGSAARSG